MKLKIMTYNIASGRKGGVDGSEISVLPMAEVIKAYDPDILGLNEVRAKHGIFTQQNEEIADTLGYDYTFFGAAIKIKGGDYGNAFVSRYPILHAEVIPVPDAPEKDPDVPYQEIDGVYYETRNIIKITILINDEKLDVFVTHFGLAPSEKENMMKTLKDALAQKENRCVLMGDFNCTPDDAYMKELSSILNNAEADVITPDDYTFASYKPDRKIDYIMVEKDIQVEKYGTIDSMVSDHRPYFIEVEI